MKVLATIIALSGILPLSAQEDITFPNVDAYFHEVWPCQDPMNGPYDMHYETVYAREPIVQVDSLSWSELTGMLLAIADDRVYLRWPIGLEEDSTIVLYDFALIPGDTAYYDMYYWYAPAIVMSVDTVTIVGRERKCFFLDNGDTWVQGIGSTMGLFRPIWEVPLGCGDPTSSFCANYVDSLGVAYEICSDMLVGLNERPRTALAFGLFPNPANGTFTVTNTQGGRPYRILDISGRVVQQGTCSDERTLVIMDGIISGAYFFTTPDGTLKVLME